MIKIQKLLFIFVSIYSILVCNIYANEDLLAPVPDEQTVPNQTGSQCVYCALEVIGNYLEIPQLYHLTDRSDCKSTSDPYVVNSLLIRLDVSFIQATNKQDGLKVIKHYVGNNIPVLIGIPGHAIVLVHYDEAANRVSIIDNVGSRKPRTWSIEQFQDRWTGWVCAINPIKPVNHNIKIKMWYYAPKVQY